MTGQNNSCLESTDKLVLSSCSKSHLSLYAAKKKKKKKHNLSFHSEDELGLYIGQTLSSFMGNVKDKDV